MRSRRVRSSDRSSISGSRGSQHRSRSRRPFAPRTIARYTQSWQRIFAKLEQGRDSRLSDLTAGFLATYRGARKDAGAAPATVNRDFCALAAFWSWCERQPDLVVARADIVKEAEPEGRERWLSADEIAVLRNAMPVELWPFFAMLVYTSLRWGEGAGLSWGDVRLAERRITVTDRARRLKNTSSNRDVPMPKTLATVLAAHRTRYPGGPADPVFPAPFNDL